PGETNNLPLEPYCHENVLELFEWFEMSDCFILILERPSPCTDLRKFLKDHKGRLSEPLAQHIMRQELELTSHLSGYVRASIWVFLLRSGVWEFSFFDMVCGDLPFQCIIAWDLHFAHDLSEEPASSS
ncbi:hypothetical protein QTP70_024122, partial [Hemibagrus guttatus]